MRQLFYELRRYLLVLLFYLIFSISVFSNSDNFYNDKIYAHLFSPNETATFVSVVYQLQTEMQLVLENLASNNVSLAHDHANKAASLVTQRILVEIAEDNPKLAGDLRNALIQLQSISLTSESQVKSTSQVVSDLNERLNADALVRMAQLQPTSSNFLEGFTKTLGTIFGGDEKETKERNAKIEALALANVIDSVLTNYGNAYHVGFDMTNMSNMVMTGKNSNAVPMGMNNSVNGNNSATDNMNMNMNMNMNINMNMHTVNSSSNTTTQHGGEMSDGYSLVNVSDYQSAQALTIKASEILNNKLKSININDKNVTSFITNLDNGLTQLNNLIANKDSPLDVMDVVHTQIHPNLQQAFSLQLR
ncbi:MAG TPA: hypothetical protein VD710_10220 [Nitrososphaeraceae archaeon]|nr:hypothetical protein [Nitrososphaeraceae archaeon]